MTESQWQNWLATLGPDVREDVKERAAIIEFEAGIDREDAQRLAKEAFTRSPNVNAAGN